MIFRVALLCVFFGAPATAQSLVSLENDFRNLFMEVECGVADEEPYDKCYKAPDLMLRHMFEAFSMRTTCPHPLRYTRFVQMAFDCSSKFRDVAGASYVQVGQCFVDSFNEKYSPASKHYCYEIEKEQG